MRKMIMCIAALAVMFSIINPVTAENITIDNWIVSYEGSGAAAISHETNLAEYTDTYYYDGNYALVVKYPDYIDDGKIVVKNTMSGELPAGTYTVSFYARGSVSAKYTTAGIGESLQYNINADNWTIESDIIGADGKKWKKYTKSVEYSGGDDKFCFIFGGYTGAWDIDTVSVTDSGGNEYIINSSFEDISESFISEYDSATYDPVNFMANPISGGLAIGWKNPSTQNLKGMALYDITGGEEIFLSDSFDITPSAINVYKATKLVNGAAYFYKLHIFCRDGTETDYYTYGIPSTSDPTLTDWSVNISKGNNNGYTAIDFSVDSTEKHEGNVSMKVRSNALEGSNVYGMLTKNVDVELGEDYRLTFWAKAINCNCDFKISNNWNTLDGNSSQYVSGIKGTYDWKQFTVDIKSISTADIRLFFLIQNICDSLWLDDFSLVKIKDNEEAGDNLLVGGGFESNYSPVTAGTVGGISTDGGDGTVKISWKSLSGAAKIKLYQLTEEGFCPRGDIPVSETNVTVGGLVNDADYTFALACVDEYGAEGERTEVSGHTVAPDFKVSQTKLYSGKNEVENIEFGKYTAQTKLRNNKLDEAVSVTQIVALYKDNTLEKLVSTAIMAEKLKPGDISTTVRTDIEVPEEEHDKYHIEVFIWNSKPGMKSLYDFAVFNQAK